MALGVETLNISNATELVTKMLRACHVSVQLSLTYFLYRLMPIITFLVKGQNFWKLDVKCEHKNKMKGDWSYCTCFLPWDTKSQVSLVFVLC